MFNPVFCLNTPPSLGLKVIAFTLHQLCNDRRSAALELRLRQLRSDLQIQTSLRHMEGFQTLRLRLRLGSSHKRYPASPQALLDQYLRQGTLRSIAPIVDLYNHWSLCSGLSIGAHDLRRLSLPVSLSMTTGQEPFQALGGGDCVTLPAGEYAYFDSHGQVICRMDHRQCAATALGADSNAALFIVQGHQDTDADFLRQTAENLKRDLLHCCSAEPRRAGGPPPGAWPDGQRHSSLQAG